MRDTLMTFITEDALRNPVKFNKEALGLKIIPKENLIQRIGNINIEGSNSHIIKKGVNIGK